MTKKSKQLKDIPDYELETMARCLLPDILAFYESDVGQKEFTKWKNEQEQLKQNKEKKEV